MIAAPQRHVVEFHAQPARGQAGDQQFVVLEPRAGAHGQRVAAGQAHGLPFDRRLRVVLDRDQQPLVALGQARRHRAGCRVALRLGLLHLVRGQIERLTLGQDRLPGEIAAHGLIQILKPRLVRGQKRQGVAKQPRGIAAVLEDRFCSKLRGAVFLPAVRMLNAEHHQARIEIVRHILPRLRQGMNAAEQAALIQFAAQPLGQFPGHPVRFALHLLGAVLGEPGHRRLRGIPVARPVLIEVGRGAGEAAQRIAKHRRRLARQHAAELDAAVFEAPVRRGRARRRAEIDRPGHAPAGHGFAEVGHFFVEAQGQGARAVDIRLDHRGPIVGEVAGQLELHAPLVDGDVRRQNQRIAIAALPQAVDNGGHQAQHATGALEFDQRRPVAVEAVEDLRVNRVGGLDALLVIAAAALGREFLLLAAIEIGEGAGYHVAVLELRRVRERLEQPAAHDLEALFGARRAPGRFDAADHVAQTVQRFAAALAADFDIVGAGMRRSGGVGGRQADHQQTVAGQFGRLGQGLGKAELGLEAAGGQIALVVKLARIGDPFIDEDQAGAVFLEQLAQRVAGTGGLVVVGGDTRIGGLAPQLPGQLAPQRAHHRAVALGYRIAGRDLVADQHDAAHGGQFFGLCFLQDGIDAGKFERIDAREQVVQGQHRVSLAAAEVGLKLHHRIAAPAGKAMHGPEQQPPQAFGEVGAPKKLHRVAVLVRALAEVNLPQIGGELGLLVAAAGHVPMRRDDVPPRFQRRRRGALDRAAGLPAPLAARLLVEAHAQQLHLEPLKLLRFGGRDRG